MDVALVLKLKVKVAQWCPTLWHHGLHSPWNSPGHNPGVSGLSLLQGIFPTQGSNPGLPRCGRILYQLSHHGSPRILEWVAYPFCGDLPDPGIKPGSPALQADSLPAELSGFKKASVFPEFHSGPRRLRGGDSQSSHLGFLSFAFCAHASSRTSVLGTQSPHLEQPFWSLSYSQMTASSPGWAQFGLGSVCF